MTRAVFAIPGDKDRRTGGFLYEATVLRVLNELGCAVAHLELPDSFPDPTSQDMSATLAMLRAVPPDQPIILDGLVFGAIDPVGLGQVRAPVVAMIHHPLALETGLAPERAAYLHTNEAAALTRAAAVIVPSPHTAGVLVRDYGIDAARITVALPGFDRPPVALAPLDPPLILSVGLLAARKGHDVLLDALAQISDVSWQAEIVGKDHDRVIARDLRAQCERLGIADRVTFAGELDAAALTGRFNAASIFALATRYEGYGMVLGEAMLYGLPVVSCDVGAVRETVAGAGVLVPPNNPAAFGHALRALLEDPDAILHQRSASLERARTLPAWADTARVFIDVINRLHAASA